MKIQGLAIIFILIILPITIILGEYAGAQIEIFRKESLYDTRLITATEDALKAFQINTFNDGYSDIANSKIESIEASANAFYNSIQSSFGVEGYSKEQLQKYIPALVYTMYDGYYIYSPYTNVADTSGVGLGIDLESDDDDINYGFKPYVYYSCRYRKGDIDVVINYSLDNYITVQGTIDGHPVYNSGYLVTLGSEGLTKNASGKYYYDGIEILQESNLTENLVESDLSIKSYKYIKLNGTKYYWDEQPAEGEKKTIFYVAGGMRKTQATEGTAEYEKYTEKINENTCGINYYASAYEFTSWVNSKLGTLTPADAVTDVPSSGTGTIFNNWQIEYPGSNFNLHRKAVIRYSIESNLSAAIANFNSYTDAEANFQMPKLKETEWGMLENEVTLISFLQGLNLGGKIYNGYTVVTNAKTEEVVKEERIYITTTDEYYHKVNDNHLKGEYAATEIVAGVLDLDFEKRKDGATGAYYTHRTQLGCYGSVVGQENLDTTHDSIYEYLQEEEIDRKIKQIYYTALGRERWGTFKVENPSNIITIIENMDANAGTGNGDTEAPEPEDTDSNQPTIVITDLNSATDTQSYVIPVGSTSISIQKRAIATDDKSGIKAGSGTLKVQRGLTTIQNQTGLTFSEASPLQITITASQAGNYIVTLQITDNSGNTATKTVRYEVVKEEEEVEATCEIQVTDTDGKTSYQTLGATIQVALTKQISVTASKGVQKIEYEFSRVATASSITSSSWKTVNGLGRTQVNATATGNVLAGGGLSNAIYLHVRVTDLDGNVTTYRKVWPVGTNGGNVSEY